MDEQHAEAVAREVMARLERAWNEGDGQAFGEPFAADADFVNVRGEHARGRDAIAAGHQAIFDTIYRGSRVGYVVTQARALTGDVLLAHVRGDLHVPSGPLAGSGQALPSVVLVRSADRWEIAAFHNTSVAPQHRATR